MANDVFSVVFTGDVAFSRLFAEGWKGEGCLSGEVLEFLRTADCAAANVESPLTRGGFAQAKDLLHASDPDSGAYLRASHMEVWNLANNHICDCGEQGLEDTLRCAEENGCVPLGAGRDLEAASQPVIVGENVRVGLLSFAGPRAGIRAESNRPGALTWDREDVIQARIARLRETCDWVVLVVHCVDEFYNLPSPALRRRYRRFLDWGADVIVSHHPHVPQPYERVGKKMIFYSLGNFIFGTEYQRAFAHTGCGVLLRLDFGKDSFAAHPFPVRIDPEEGRVSKGTMPAIFCEMTDEDFRLLWPLETRRLFPLEMRRRAVRHPGFPGKGLAGAAKVCVFYLKRLAHRQTLRIELERAASYLGAWRRSPKREAAAYLLEDRKLLKTKVK